MSKSSLLGLHGRYPRLTPSPGASLGEAHDLRRIMRLVAAMSQCVSAAKVLFTRIDRLPKDMNREPLDAKWAQRPGTPLQATGHFPCRFPAHQKATFHFYNIPAQGRGLHPQSRPQEFVSLLVVCIYQSVLSNLSVYSTGQGRPVWNQRTSINRGLPDPTSPIQLSSLLTGLRPTFSISVNHFIHESRSLGMVSPGGAFMK